MNIEEWHERYVQRLVDKGFSYRETFAILIAGIGNYDYKDSPKDAADEELSYWTDDG
jgi:predicted transcriptional regulator